MSQERAKRYGQIIAKCWADPEFKARLLADPRATLAAEGFNVPDSIEVLVMENTPRVVHMVLPPAPAEGELEDEALEAVAGGAYWGCWCG